MEPVGGHYARSVGCVMLTYEQGVRLKAIHTGLTACNATLKNGALVEAGLQNAVKWILENIEIDVEQWRKKMV